MSTDTIIRAAMDAGVALKFVDGKLKAVGHVDAVAAWAPRLRQHRAALIEALAPAAPEPPINPDAWRELDRAYLAHHVNCVVCQAAGRGSRYARRCGAGASLWSAYRAASSTN
ncbi:hypothetical protein [Acidovorax sp. JHL-9]|uniref:hypothetical protein n=1 Tax=Acidovorax sp. JHL-9 TaxID=1276756 RepID=UPI00041486C8|nr:hypothetical protein [Acidovorax sp. JHL-9]